ncbi:MAG TPA: LEA type 2 family protein [Longimicrobium sp.]|nr:LEA type 2 family protein [Longimicrobium sp.]
MKVLKRGALLLAMTVALPGCATLQQLGIQAPQFQVDGGQQAQIRLLAPGPGRPSGGASVRLFARVTNPNPIGITLSTLAGGLELQGRQAARVDFPLGVPLQAGGQQVIPLDITVNFDDIPTIGSVLLRAVTGQSIGYRLNGTVGVNAGLLGQPTFGPMTLLEGNVRVQR